MVEVMIVTKDTALCKKLCDYTDSVITQKNLRYLSLLVKQPDNVEEAVRLMKRNKVYLVFLDIRSGGYEDLKDLNQKNCFLVVLDKSFETAARLLNAGIQTMGYLLYQDTLNYQEYEDFLVLVYKNLPFSVKGILVYDYEEDIHVLIPFSDILYIETIKGTHYGMIVCQDRRYQIRLNLKRMMQDLPWYFHQARSSAIVNMLEVRKIDFTDRILTLSNGDTCSFALKYKKIFHAMFCMEEFKEYQKDNMNLN
ncbi:MAG: LytTR family transcriptional regulator DNA-binding domain-containing protein [Thermoflexaceae bacterium]|nr:LytTR family transcriptional regulator DNA-binding domain-containing protein [Thermoflexaceae bacterium]